MNRVYIKTYGCQMNERDSASVASALRARGYTIVEEEAEADIVLLNTCSVRDQAEQKAIGKAGRFLKQKRRKNPKLLVGIMGCMAQNRGADILDSLPDLDLIVGTQKFHHIPEHLDAIIATRTALGPIPSTVRDTLVDIAAEEGSQNTVTGHAEGREVCSFVSIQQGCDMKCAFCIVPATRGDERSRPMESILTEIRTLAAAGTREVNLLGQIVTSFGRKSDMAFVDQKSPFVQLLEAIEKIDGIERVRFTSPHPRGFKDDLVACYGRLSKLCEYVHLPLQSGSDRILQAMRRPYGRERYFEIIQALRARVPDIYISTDIIVGFPGETDEDFQQTYELFDRVGFDMAYIFKYSQRTGTDAATMEAQVPEEVKESRNQSLLALLHKHSLRRSESLIGTTQEVLVEGRAHRGERMMGRNRGGRRVVFPGDESLIGQLVRVAIARATVTTLEGEIVP